LKKLARNLDNLNRNLDNFDHIDIINMLKKMNQNKHKFYK